MALAIILMLNIGMFGAFAESGEMNIAVPAGKVLMQEVDYNIVPGVVETDVFLNSASGDEQSAGFLTTISPSAKVTFKVSYPGYYTAESSTESRKLYADSIAADWKWSLESVPDQAAAYEKATGSNVIAATNGDYYNMQTARPLGCLVMEGNVIQKADEPYFAVLKDGSFVIRDAYTDCSDVLEAVSGPFFIINNGEITSNATNDKLNPVNSIGLKADGTVVMFQVDGRQAPYSVGMTLYDLASFLKAQGVVRALYLDGGGSATYASQREGDTELQVRGSPSDGVIRAVASALLVVSNEENDNTFDHARIEPAGGIYEQGSRVQFSAVGVSACGAPAPMPADYEWIVMDETSGNIDENGIFEAKPDFEGIAVVQIVSDGRKIGQASIRIADISKLCFANESHELDLSKFGEGWFELGYDVYHFDEVGHAHRKASVSDTRTCTQYGQFKYTCPDCGKEFGSNAIWPEGHEWNENHVCVKCGKQGIDISTCTVNTNTVEFNGSAALTGVAVFDGDTRLSIKSSEVAADGYILYSNYTSVGYGMVTIKGCGDYYGTISKTYKIVPASVKKINVDSVSGNSVALSWDSSLGAQNYWLSYSSDGGTNWKYLNTKNTNITVNELQTDTEYSFRVFATAKVDGTNFNSLRYSEIAKAYVHAHSIALKNAKAASCTEAGYSGDEVCTVCNAVVSTGETIAALGHKAELKNVKSASCTEAGYSGDKVCTVCNAVVSTGETIAALGHKTELKNVKAASCTEAGYSGDEVCTVCNAVVSSGETIAALGHKTELKNVKAASCTEDGYSGDEVCTVCNNIVKQGDITAKLAHSFKNGICTVCGSKDSGYKPPKNNPFVDVKETDYFYEAVQWAVNHDPAVTSGTDATHFSPKADCTRGQAVTFLWRSAGCPTPAAKSCTFTDVKEDAYYYTAVLWAEENDITKGTSATTFSPDEKVTRAQAVAFLYRMEGEPEVSKEINPFEDVDANKYYYEAVQWAVDKGITYGMDEKHFGPSVICSRAHIVSFIFQYDNAKMRMLYAFSERLCV